MPMVPLVGKAEKVSDFMSVSDEALIAETMVWPNFFLMNGFYALKES